MTQHLVNGHLDRPAIQAAFDELLSGELGSRERLAIAAMPLLTIVTRQFLRKNQDAVYVIDDLESAANSALGEAIVAIERKLAAGNRRPINTSICAYFTTSINNAIRRAFAEAPLIGPCADTVFKNQRRERAEESGLADLDRKIKKSLEREKFFLDFNAPLILIKRERKLRERHLKSRHRILEREKRRAG